MPDLERDLRELLTDDRLDLPVRRDAVRIVHEGVRRRRRRRTIAMTTAVAATVGAVVAAAIAVPAALDAGGKKPTQPVHPKLGYDVAWINTPAPKPWFPKPIQPKPPSMNAPRCLASQLHIGAVVGNGATGMEFFGIPLRNISNQPCLLVGSPMRVVAQAAGQPDVVATRGLHLGSGGAGGDLQPGKRGYLSLETDRDCSARYATPNTFPTKNYTSVTVTLPSATSFTIPLKLDVECGLRTGGLGVQLPPPTDRPDPRSQLVASIDAPLTVRAGTTLTYVVTLTNPTAATISLRHCPGYAEWLGAGVVELAKNAFGLDCSTVRAIEPGQSVRYEMQLAVPADASWPDPVQLSWALEAGVKGPVSTPIRLVAPRPR